MIDYNTGFARFTFDTQKYNFRELMREHLSSLSHELGGADVGALEQVHESFGIKENVEKYRQAAFALFRKESFQTMFKQFGIELIDKHFGGIGLIQKTPTVRIQLPGANSTSYHCDGWYGHGPSVKSFWLPLTEVRRGSTLHMAKNLDVSVEAMKTILKSKSTLDEINQIISKVCEPFEGQFGDVLTFSSNMVHGAEKSTLDTSRVSFDFRIAPNPDDIGTKPKSNFYSRDELAGLVLSEKNLTGKQANLRGITYSNLCGGKSAKAQLMLSSAFADANNIDVIGNESEIVALDYMPVLRSYLQGESSSSNCVVVFGLDIFEGNIKLAREILDCADRGKRLIVFCAEGYFYGDNSIDKEALLGKIK
jgi:hypothetical protein